MAEPESALSLFQTNYTLQENETLSDLAQRHPAAFLERLRAQFPVGWDSDGTDLRDVLRRQGISKADITCALRLMLSAHWDEALLQSRISQVQVEVPRVTSLSSGTASSPFSTDLLAAEFAVRVASVYSAALGAVRLTSAEMAVSRESQCERDQFIFTLHKLRHALREPADPAAATPPPTPRPNVAGEQFFRRCHMRRVLCIDGGGSRGIVALAHLRRIESMLKVRLGVFARDQFRLADVFDDVIGTSTGGIIAAGIRERWTVAEIMNLYKKLLPQLFSKGMWRWPVRVPRLWKQGWYSTSDLEKILTENFGNAQLVACDQVPRMVLTTWVKKTQESLFLDSHNPEFGVLPLVTALRMTSAAPFYFSFVVHGQSEYRDGGMFCNNPTNQFILNSGISVSETPSVIVSIGTGHFEHLVERGMLENLVDNATEVNNAARNAHENCRNTQTQVFRVQSLLARKIDLDAETEEDLKYMEDLPWPNQPMPRAQHRVPVPSLNDVVNALIGPQGTHGDG